MIKQALRQMSLRRLMVLIAILACALGLVRQPIVWVVLDARRTTMTSAVLRYATLWGGFALAVLLIETPRKRLLAYGWVILASYVIAFFSPHLHVGIEPDTAAYFNSAMSLGMLMCWIGAVIERRFEVGHHDSVG